MNKILRISIVVVICLIVILAIALIIGQCSNTENEDTTPSTPETPVCTEHVDADNNNTCDVCGEAIPVVPPVCTEHVDADNNNACDVCGEAMPVVPPVCTEHVDADNNNVCDVCGEELENSSVDAEFTETNDKVYVISEMLNLRKTPDETGTATVAVVRDTELERLGYYATGENAGLSKITYENEIYYVATDYITTQKPLIDADFTTVEETVYVVAGRSPYVFSRPSHIEKHQYSEMIDTLVPGQAVTRLGVATKEYIDDEGTTYTFAKVTYESNGKTYTGYVNNTLLTTEVPADPDNGIVFEADTSTLKVIAETSINLRTSAHYPAENIGGHASNGQLLQATHKGTESDGTVWYKVIFEEETYYVIFNASLLEVQTSSAQ